MKKMMLSAALAVFAAFAGYSAVIEVGEDSGLGGHETSNWAKYAIETRLENPYSLSMTYNDSPAVLLKYDDDDSDYIIVLKMNVPAGRGVAMDAKGFDEAVAFREDSKRPIFPKTTIDKPFSFTFPKDDDKDQVFYVRFLTENPDENLQVTIKSNYFDFEHGRVESDSYLKEAGDAVFFRAEPEKGYKLETMQVTWNGEELCFLSDNRIILPKGEITVSATFTKTDKGDEENPNPDNGGNQNPTGVEDVNVSAQSIVGEKFHTILGQPLTEPQTSGVTVVTRTYSDGAVRSSKEVR